MITVLVNIFRAQIRFILYSYMHYNIIVKIYTFTVSDTKTFFTFLKITLESQRNVWSYLLAPSSSDIIQKLYKSSFMGFSPKYNSAFL
jgi:hypothetical protein